MTAKKRPAKGPAKGPATRPAKRAAKKKGVARKSVSRETVRETPHETLPAEPAEVVTQPTAEELRRARTPEIKARGLSEPGPRQRGRPAVTLTVEHVKLIETLSLYRCTINEISGALRAIGVDYSERSLRRNYGRRIKEWRDAGKATLRRAQWQKALSGNPTMLIWMGKQVLGQRDKQDTRLAGEGGGPVEVHSAVTQVMVIGGQRVVF